MGLKSIVRDELSKRKLEWTVKSPQAAPNKKASAKLERRRRSYAALDARTKASHTAPGSYNRKRG